MDVEDRIALVTGGTGGLGLASARRMAADGLRVVIGDLDGAAAVQAAAALPGEGCTKDWPVERLLRDAKLHDIGAGTNEFRRYPIGRELVGQ